jgi:hypothetical protein
VFYLDNEFIAEEPQGRLPYEFLWHTSGVSAGGHVVTVNLVGFEDWALTASIGVRRE